MLGKYTLFSFIVYLFIDGVIVMILLLLDDERYTISPNMAAELILPMFAPRPTLFGAQRRARPFFHDALERPIRSAPKRAQGGWCKGDRASAFQGVACRPL